MTFHVQISGFSHRAVNVWASNSTPGVLIRMSEPLAQIGICAATSDAEQRAFNLEMLYAFMQQHSHSGLAAGSAAYIA